MKWPIFRRKRPPAAATTPAAPPDLALIARVQQARMAHDAEAVPSQVGSVYWVEAKPSVPTQTPTQTPTPRAGHVLIETTADRVDALWAIVRAATQAGELGYKAKVATVSRTADPDARTIQILLYDLDDQADVDRVTARLRELGVAE